MVRAITVALLLITCSGVSGAARLLLDDGSFISGEVIRIAGGKTLVHTRGPEGSGLVWIETAKIKGTQPEPPGTAATLDTIMELVERGQMSDALERLDLLMRRETPQRDTLLLYARALRKAWMFRGSLFLYERLIADAGPAVPIDLIKEAAEAATLIGVEKDAEAAIKRLKNAAKQNRDLQKYADALRDQLRGGAQIVRASPPEAKASREELEKERSKYESDDGDCFLSAQIAARLLGALTSAYSAIPIRVQVGAQVHNNVREEYRKGGDEEAFVAAVRKVRVLVSVDDTLWIEMFDWRKHGFLLQCLFAVAETYTAAEIELTVLRGKPDPKVVQTKDLATASMAPDRQTKMSLFTPRNRDIKRDAQLREYERERKELEQGIK